MCLEVETRRVLARITQRIKALADKPNGLSSNPRTQVWKENPNSHKLSSDFHMYAVAFTHIHINKWQCVYYYYHFKKTFPKLLVRTKARKVDKAGWA